MKRLDEPVITLIITTSCLVSNGLWQMVLFLAEHVDRVEGRSTWLFLLCVKNSGVIRSCVSLFQLAFYQG
jgi:hypothetical protein